MPYPNIREVKSVQTDVLYCDERIIEVNVFFHSLIADPVIFSPFLKEQKVILVGNDVF